MVERLLGVAHHTKIVIERGVEYEMAISRTSEVCRWLTFRRIGPGTLLRPRRANGAGRFWCGCCMLRMGRWQGGGRPWLIPTKNMGPRGSRAVGAISILSPRMDQYQCTAESLGVRRGNSMDDALGLARGSCYDAGDSMGGWRTRVPRIEGELDDRGRRLRREGPKTGQWAVLPRPRRQPCPPKMHRCVLGGAH
jgi:hypothetical protein